jgi:hypothetical protein
VRIWSLNPKYLNSKGLVALWRETLLAKNVLKGKTKGYKNHPQLKRFVDSGHPHVAINSYLLEVFNEATERGYNFDFKKIEQLGEPERITVNDGQVRYERQHLLSKLKNRGDLDRHALLKIDCEPELHSLFTVVPGPIEAWEKV